MRCAVEIIHVLHIQKHGGVRLKKIGLQMRYINFRMWWTLAATSFKILFVFLPSTLVTGLLLMSDSLLKGKWIYGYKMQLNSWSSHFFHGAVTIYMNFFFCHLIEINWCCLFRLLISFAPYMFLFAIESVFIILCCSDECYISSSFKFVYVLKTQSFIMVWD